ncbi:hypothetical protein AVDCRST_MAG94-780 [uncultured Leptolyngbya sp.]|uniref:Uncharacterized protein n=1 Tax=uncultured Leptolyngbya sp. TaxID=332963 RepID=A0A6J4KKV7_9CYAN|nr:hypothetical protein AVDCRST_MAG94-780 [uncultured Leptolyngbya sp.]
MVTLKSDGQMVCSYQLLAISRCFSVSTDCSSSDRSSRT